MNDERNAASGKRVRIVVDASQEPIAVAPPPHAPQQGLRHVLQREVEVGHAGVADDVDQVVGEVRRIQVEQPHARHAGRHLADERHDRAPLR